MFASFPSQHSVATFNVSPVHTTAKSLSVSAVAVPRVTCDLPIHFDSQWTHLKDLKLADPDFGRPGRIDMFDWVLAGKTNSHTSVCLSIATHHVSVTSADDLLRKFWEIEESPKGPSNLSPDERLVVQHFKDTHTRSDEGRFIVPLPKIQITWRVEISSCETIFITRTFTVLERSIPKILHCNGGILQDESC